MSTDLYGIRVLSVDPERRQADLRVFVVYYDTAYESHQPLPDDTSFFFRILWDKADSRFYSGALGEEVDVNDYLDEGFVDANTYRYVEAVECLEARNVPVKDWGVYSDFYYERGGAWVDEDKLVQADYRVTVTHEKYLEHLSEGLSWGTTAYETMADRLRPGERLPDLRFADQTLFPFEGQEQEAGTPSAAAFSGCGRFLAVANDASEVVVYDVDGFEERWRASLPDDILFANLGVTEEGWVWLGRPGSGGVWDMESGERLEEDPPVARLASADSRWFLDYGDDDVLLVLDEAGEVVREVETDLGCVEAVSLTSDGERVALGGMSPGVEIRDLTTGELLDTVETSSGTLAMALSGDDRYLALSRHIRRRGGYAEVLRMEDGQPTRKLHDRGHFLTDFAWSPDGRWLAVVKVVSANGYTGRVTLHRVSDADDTEAQPSDEAGEGGMSDAQRRAAQSDPVAAADWREAVEAHQGFLEAGGGEGRWTVTTSFGVEVASWDGPAVEAGRQLRLRRANLEGLSMAGLSLRGAELLGCHAPGTDWSGADLRGACLAGAWLPGADFTGADLREAVLDGANLDGASMDGAKTGSDEG